MEYTEIQTDVQKSEVLQTVHNLLLPSKELKLNFELNSDWCAEACYIFCLLLTMPCYFSVTPSPYLGVGLGFYTSFDKEI